MRVFFLSFVLICIFYFIFSFWTSNVLPAHADVSSQPIYGGGQMYVSAGGIAIDKKIANPQASNWVDNLTINDPKYQPESLISFQINLTNTGNIELKRIEVKDVFPQFVNFNSGPGSFDPNTKTLSFEVNDLKPKESRTFIVVGKVVPSNQLPVDQGSICMVNQATASTTNSGRSQDVSLFCIQKEVLGTQNTLPNDSKGVHQTMRPNGGFPVFPPPDVTTTPATGAETLLLFSLLPTGIAGWLLRKYSK